MAAGYQTLTNLSACGRLCLHRNRQVKDELGLFLEITGTAYTNIDEIDEVCKIMRRLIVTEMLKIGGYVKKEAFYSPIILRFNWSDHLKSVLIISTKRKSDIKITRTKRSTEQNV